MDVHIRLTRRGDLSVQIYRQLLDAILDGRLRSGERLPPTRDLARRLAVSRNTVAVAYERLAADGVLVGRVGAGSFVSTEPLQPAELLQPVRRVSARRAPLGAVHPRDVWRSVASVPLLADPLANAPGYASGASPNASASRARSGVGAGAGRGSGLGAGSGPETDSSTGADADYDFSLGTPDPALFPFSTWRRLVAHALRASPARYAEYGDPAGDAGLRAAIARHVGISRAVRADAGDVIVTQGAQQAFDLIGRVLISEREGTCVAVEDPGYPFARELFRSLGAQIVGVRVDDEGLIVEALPKQARIVYVTPSHQLPLGMAMSLARRTALLAWAERRGALIIEDDYDSEFRFTGRPLDPLQSLDRAGRVIYVGSFSKVLLPTLRIGFLIAPASLQPALCMAKRLTDWHGELATQAALARFIDQGLLARHIRKVSREYAARHARLTESLERRAGRWLRVIPSAAGLHVAAEMRPGLAASLNASEIAHRARARGIRVRALADFHVAAPTSLSSAAMSSSSASAAATSSAGPPPLRSGFVLGYGTIPTSRIDDGVRRLAALARRG